jgi:hypothetical protein
VADDVAELCALQDEPRRPQADALLGRCWVELNGGRFDTAAMTARSVLSSGAAREDTSIARRAHLEITLACWMLGDHRSLASHAEQATAVDARFAAPVSRARTDFRLGLAAVMAGDPPAPRNSSGTPSRRPTTGFARVGVACRGVLIAALTLAGDVAGARRELRRTRAVASEVDGAEHVVPVGWEHFPPFAALAARHAHRIGDVVALRRVQCTVGSSDGPYAAAVRLLTAGLASTSDPERDPATFLHEAAARFEALDLPRETAVADRDSRW